MVLRIVFGRGARQKDHAYGDEDQCQDATDESRCRGNTKGPGPVGESTRSGRVGFGGFIVQERSAFAG